MAVLSWRVRIQVHTPYRAQHWNPRSCCSSHQSTDSEPAFTQQTNDQGWQAQTVAPSGLGGHARLLPARIGPGDAPTAPSNANSAWKQQLRQNLFKASLWKQAREQYPTYSPCYLLPFSLSQVIPYDGCGTSLVPRSETEFCYRDESGQDSKNPRNV